MRDDFRPADKAPANLNFKVSDFYLNSDVNYVNKPGTLKILTYNVHELVSLNANDTVEKTYDELVKFINKVKPDVLILQEMIFPYVTRLRTDCGFRKMQYTPNGTFNNSLVVAAYTRDHSEMTQIKYKPKMYRNFILIDYKGYKIAGCHLEIGKRYMKNGSIIWREHFQQAYDENIKIRKDSIDEILRHKPDVVAGDMNFMPGGEECDYVLENGYKYDCDDITTVHKNKVDFVFYRDDGLTQVIKHVYSDHYPVLTQLPPKSRYGGGGGGSYNGGSYNGGSYNGGSCSTCGDNSALILMGIIIVLIILMVCIMYRCIFYEVKKEKTYDYVDFDKWYVR